MEKRAERPASSARSDCRAPRSTHIPYCNRTALNKRSLWMPASRSDRHGTLPQQFSPEQGDQVKGKRNGQHPKPNSGCSHPRHST